MCLYQVASSHTSSVTSSNQGGVDAEELVQKMQLISSGVRGRTSALIKIPAQRSYLMLI